MSFIRILVHIAVLSVAVPLTIGFYQWLKGGKLLVKLVLLFVVFIAVVEAIGYYTGSKGINNLWLSHIYIPIEYALLGIIFYFSFDSKALRRAVLVSVVLFAVFCVIDALYIESMLTFNSYPRTAESALLISLALLYFNKVFIDLDQLNLERDPMFLLSAGVIIYFAGTVTVYVFINLLIEQSQEYARIFFSITYVLNTGFNLLLALVLWRAPRT